MYARLNCRHTGQGQPDSSGAESRLWHALRRRNLPSAVNAVLAGELEGGWKLRWRLKYFFLLVKLQKRWPLVPHLPFLPGRAKAAKPSERAAKV